MRKSPPALRRLLLTALAVVLLASACGSDETTAADDTSPDRATWPHDFRAPLLGGGTFDAGDYEGQDLVLWFWAPW